MSFIYIGPHEKAENPNSITGTFAGFYKTLANSFNTHLKEYQESLKNPWQPGGPKTASVKRLLADRVLHRPLYVKGADFAGGPETGEIERALEQIAERQIATRAPALMPFWLGFQLLKKTDDNTRACGIFAFKAGDELIYIPVFCINGELQGHELMYLVSQDRFVPSDEKQVNYLLSRKPMEPGKVELRDRSDIRQRSALRPNVMQSGLKLSSLSEVPRLPNTIVEDALRKVFKEAAVTNVLESLRFKGAMADLKMSDLFDLSAKATKLASQWSKDYPVYGRLLDYALEGLSIDALHQEWEKRAGIAKQLGIVPCPKPTLMEYLRSQHKKEAAATPYVSVKTAEQMPDHQFRFMPTEAIDKLHRRGYFVVDTRDQTKLAALYEAVEPKDIKNPHLPGLYNVFMADGTFKKCVIVRRWKPGHRAGASETNEFAIFHPSSGTYTTAKAQDILVDNSQPDGDWFKEVTKGSKAKPSREHTSSSPRPESLLISPNGTYYSDWYIEEGDHGAFLCGGTLILPVPRQNGFKEVQSYGDVGNQVITTSPETKLVWYSRDLTLGGLTLWQEKLHENTVPVKVQKRDKRSGRYSIDGFPELGKTAALETLMIQHHLSEGTAEYLLEKADAQYPFEVHARREKVAFSGRPSQDPISVNFPVKDKGTDWLTGLETEQDLHTSERVDSLANIDPRTNLDFWPGAIDVADLPQNPPSPNAHDIQMATRASESGQREFVSSQMLMSLLREIDDDGIISKYISVFEKACDALGRLYMQVLWRVDAFEERFGETQLKEFQEMLLDLFQGLGDFICYLRQRDVRPESRIALEHVTDMGQDFGTH